MLVNLDPWFNPDNWPKKPVVQTKGVAVIDQCLEMPSISELSCTNAAIDCSSTNSKALVRGPPKTSPKANKSSPRVPRKKNVPSRFRDVYVHEPSGYCPKCSKYVRHTDYGAACIKCQAFWHNSCVGITQEELDEKWSNKPFLCPTAITTA